MRRSWILALTALLTAGPALAAAPLPPQLASLAPGHTAQVLVAAGAPLADGTTFPANNDLTAYVPIDAHEGYLLVGHELRWGSDAWGGRFTRLKLRDHVLVGSQAWVSGMHLNCAGTVTPWGTILSGEEFPHKALPGEASVHAEIYETGRIPSGDPAGAFGWIYEIQPLGPTPAGAAVRRTALGRFSHESAAVVGTREVYLTEDYPGGFFYRFVADRPQDLSSGQLYAFDRKRSRWLRLKDPLNAHAEARTLGATPFNRLEDLQLGPDGELYIAETGDPAQHDPLGRILRFNPTTLRMEAYLEGDGKRLANPDNLLFDKAGNLFVCEDQFEENQTKFGANELLVVDPERHIKPLLSLAKGFEPSGPSFHADGHTLYFSALNGKKSAVMAVDGF